MVSKNSLTKLIWGDVKNWNIYFEVERHFMSSSYIKVPGHINASIIETQEYDIQLILSKTSSNKSQQLPGIN